MTYQHIPAQTMITCDRCAERHYEDRDPDAAWRPDWQPVAVAVTIDGKSYDLCMVCYGQLQKFMKKAL